MSQSTGDRRVYRIASALLPSGFCSDVTVEVDSNGFISSVASGSSAASGKDSAADFIPGVAVPGMINLHSHAFQRALAGLTERAGPNNDNFWSWRETMYRFLDRLGPDDVQAIAAQLYVELLKAGYTSVAEFHYLHNDVSGVSYGDVAELSHRIVAAADLTGIGLSLLPALYQTSQFGGAPPAAGQRRFILETDAFETMIDALQAKYGGDRRFSIGVAPHSLRAVTPDGLRAAIACAERLATRAPIHIHVAEQAKEVADCLAWSGLRPLDWLMENAPVDKTWCLIHCTQSTAAELRRAAARGVTIALCPTTEANLGDGLFAFGEFSEAGGHFGIGSDANLCASPSEELRLVEYGQRLVKRARNVSQPAPGAATGAWLFRQALKGGARASGRAVGAIEPGRRADLVLLDPNHPSLCGRDGDDLINSWIFNNLGNPVRDVMVGGVFVIRDGAHVQEEQVAREFRRSLARVSSF